MSAQARRALLGVLVERGISMRRACVLLSVARSSVRYQSQQGPKDAALLTLLRQVAARHPRFGYRRAWAWLRRRGHRVNRKRVYRLWLVAGLGLPRWRSRRRVRRGPRALPIATAPTEVWALDLLHARCGNGRVVRCLSVLDEYTRECLALVVRPRVGSEQVVRCLAELVAEYGRPQAIRTDNGPEFRAVHTLAWLRTHGIAAAYIEPGKPWQNGVVESFHSRVRDECLDREWLASPAEARVILEEYRRTYNTTHLHSSLNYQTPNETRINYDTKVDSGFPQSESHTSRRVSV